MFGFFKKKNRCLGVDFGTTGVKIVELKKENNLPVFVNYAISYDSASFLQASNPATLDSQSQGVLNLLLKKGNFETKSAVIGIPGFYSLIFFIELPEMPKDDIDKAVRFEAAKFIPTPLADVSLGWEIIGGVQEKSVEGGQMAGKNRKIQIMGVSVPRSTTEKYAQIAKMIKLDVEAMEVEDFAAVRALVGNDKGTFIISNIGSKATDFTIVSDGVVRMTRNIDVGGAEISRSLASGLGIDSERAEQLKRSDRINLLDPHNDTSRLVGPVVGIFKEEIKKLCEVYHQKNPLKKIEKVIFTGGTSKMHSLVPFFAAETGIDCQLGNTFARVGILKKHQPLLEEVGPELTIAIGLAMRGLEKYK